MTLKQTPPKKKKKTTRSYENFSTGSDKDEGQIPVVLTHQLNTSV